jgi:oligopeptide transport system substrate-binding protein
VPVPGPTVSATPSPVLRLAVSPPTSLDPRDSDSPDSLLLVSQVFDGLVAYEPETLAAAPAAAERWEVLDRGQRFVFHLRRGATFHDGSPVTAGDFITAWNRLADPIAAKPFGFLLEQVEGFRRYRDKLQVPGLSGLRATSDRTLEVTLERPWPDFVSLLGHPALSPVPPTVTKQSFGAQPIGNGPYRVASPLSTGTPLFLQRHEAYYGTPPATPMIEYRTFDTPEESWPEFLAGELDLAPIPAPLLAEAQSQFGGAGVQTLARLLYCGFNEADERFQDRALRTAVSLAVNRDQLATDVYAGLATPAGAMVPPTIPGHRGDVCADRCAGDLDRARSLASGIPRAARTFSLDFPASSVGKQLAQALAAQLGEARFTVTPRPHDRLAYESLLERGEQEMFCLVWVADYPRQQAFLEPILEAGSVDNLARVNDEELTALLERARRAPDPGVRQDIYVETERRALEQMHVVPLLWFRSHLGVQPSVQDFVLDPLGRYDAAALSSTP